MMNFDLNLLSKYRNALMGLAAIMVILCHASQYGVVMPDSLRYIIVRGGIGVDIFLFLSGLGCYYSLQKNNNLKQWYKKRFIRIFIPYTLIQIPFWLFYISIGDFNWKEELLVFLTVAFWTEHVGAWYVALLIPLYLVTPILFSVLRHEKYKWAITLLLILVLLFVCHVNIQGEGVWYNVITNMQWAFCRVISFILGLAIAPLVQKGVKINPFVTILFFIGLNVGVHRFIDDSISMWWSIVPLLLIVFVYFLQFIPSKGVVSKCIFWMGTVSLESYLANIYLCEIMEQMSIKYFKTEMFNGHYLEYVLIILMGTLLAYVVNKASLIVKSIIKV